MAALNAARSFWREASPVKRALLAGAPAAIIIIATATIAFVLMSGGDGTDKLAAAQDGTPTEAAATSTPTLTTEQVLTYFAAVLPTQTPAKADVEGLVANNPTSGAPPVRQYVPRPATTGPGSIVGTDMSISIPSIGVNASVYARSIGTNGQMGNPSGAWDVIWYDFSANWPGLGGYPGSGNSNAVFAGHVDYIRVGPAVFWSVRNLAPGDIVTVYTPNGAINYSIQWTQWAGPGDDFTPFVEQTGGDVITLVTCIGGFSGGHYSNRFVVRGTRI